MGSHAARRRPSLLSAVILSAIIIALCAGVLGMVSLISHGDPAQSTDTGSEVAPTPYSLTFESATPTVTVTAIESVPQMTTARSTVTARVTTVHTSAAPTATVTTRVTAPAPTVTECRVWDSSQARWVVQDCSQSPRTETP